jgi:hypothetical protein
MSREWRSTAGITTVTGCELRRKSLELGPLGRSRTESSHQRWPYAGALGPLGPTRDCHGAQHPSKPGQNRKPCVHCASDVHNRKPRRHLGLRFDVEALTFAPSRCLVPRTVAALEACLASAGQAMTGWNFLMDPMAHYWHSDENRPARAKRIAAPT